MIVEQRNLCWRSHAMKRFSIVAAVTILLFSPTLSSSQTVEEVKESGKYLVAVNNLVARTSQLLNQSSSFDDIAFGLTEKKIDGGFARRQARSLSARLRQELITIRRKTEALPPLPTEVNFKKLKTTMRIARKTLEESVQFLGNSIESGESIVRAALDGKEGVVAKIEVRRLQRNLATFNRQIGNLQLQVLNERPGSMNFYLYKFFTEYYKVITVPLEYLLDQIEDKQIVRDVSIKSTHTIVLSHIDNAFDYVRKGRHAFTKTLKSVNKLPIRQPKDRKNKEVLVKMLNTFPESFDSCEKILSILEKFTEQMVKYKFDVPDDIANDYFVAISTLESEINQQFIDRQKMIAQMQ
jgi:hypothetical protein